MKRLLLLLFLLALAVGLGVWLGSGSRQPTRYEIERTSMNVQMARTMLPFRIAFRVLLGLVALFTLGGLGWGAAYEAGGVGRSAHVNPGERRVLGQAVEQVIGFPFLFDHGGSGLTVLSDPLVQLLPVTSGCHGFHEDVFGGHER